MAKRKYTRGRFKVGDCVRAPGDPEFRGSVGRVVRKTGDSFAVKFFGRLRPIILGRYMIVHAACTRSAPLAGTKRRRRRK